MEDPVVLRQDGGIATLLLNRPASYNAFDREMIEALADILPDLGSDQRVRGVILTGQGKSFCAGGNLKWALEQPHGPSQSFYGLATRFHQAIVEIRRMPKPVIAAVNGVAAGGGFSLALACDFRVMSESATMRQAYTSSGLSIDGGGSFTLPRLVGLARAMEIMAFDEPISAQQALDWGLATKVAREGEVLREAMIMAERLASGSSNSMAWTKRLLTDSFNTSLESQLEREREGISSCAAHPDGQEGMRAFQEKRRPVFTGGGE